MAANKKKKIVSKKKAVKLAKRTVKKAAKRSAPARVKKNVNKSSARSLKKAKTVKKVKKAVVSANKKTKKIAKKTIKKTAKKPVKKTVKKAAPQLVKRLPAVSKQPILKSNVKKTTKKVGEVTPMFQQPATVKKQAMGENQHTAVVSQPKLKPKSNQQSATLLGELDFVPYEPEVTEDYMNEEQRAHFQKILEAWRQQLMQDVDTTVGHLKEDAEFYADPVDRAAQEEGFSLELRTRDRERKLIKKIEQSLDLLKKGEYGYCEDCGAEIGIRRLEARPTAVKCIDCKTYQEIREKQLGS